VEAVLDNLGVFLVGIRTTIALALVSGSIALVLGVLLATLRVSSAPTFRLFGAAYVEVFRNIPSTILFFFAAFVLPQLGIHFSYFTFAAIALTAYYAAFFCEAVRSGINSVALGQAEAARSIGLTFGASLRAVVLPQAVRSTIPLLINVFIALVKSTAVASAFGVNELLANMQNLVTQEGQAVFAILIATALFYLAITIPAGLLATHLERKLAFAR
jgi:glutamate transport system permease protein